MTFSGDGRGPHIWVPRRLSGLGQAPGGKYIIPATVGTIEAVTGSSSTTLQRTVSAGAQGYIPASVAGSLPRTWVPLVDPTTSQGQSVIGQWGEDQAAIFGHNKLDQGVDLGRRAFEDLLSGTPASGTYRKVEADIKEAMPAADISQWGITYLLHHPELFTQAPTPETAVAMAQAFIAANCKQIGLPPEFIAASQLVRNFPTTVENAEQWGITIGTAYLSQFGVPIITDANPNTFLASCARGAIAQTFPGIPLSLCESTYGSLSNGSINFDEAQGLAIQACGFIVAAVGQAFGLPAPIGAVLGQIIASVLVPIVCDLLGFGPSDSEKLNRAQEAARKAADAATIACTDLARALWLQYQHYWESMQGNLNTLMHVNQEWLLASGSCGRDNGVFLFPASSPGADTLDIVRDPVDGGAVLLNESDVRAGRARAQYMRYQKPVVGRSCSWTLGCPYGAYGIEGVVYRDKYDLSMGELKQKRKPVISQGGYGACDALGALAFWNARRYVTPWQVHLAMNGQEYTKERFYSADNHVLAGRPNMWLQRYDNVAGQLSSRNVAPWDSEIHSDEEYLQNIGRVSVAGSAGETVGDCLTPRWGAYLYGSLQQAAAASALVQRDVTRTVMSKVSQYRLQRHMEDLAGVAQENAQNRWMVASAAQQRAAVRAATARAASFRTAITEAKRKGSLRGERMNYGLLAAGGAALAGWAVARRRR
jgi:hypothetical protein